MAVCGADGAYAENIDQKEGVWLQQSAARCNSSYRCAMWPEHVMGLSVLQVRHKIVYGRSRAFSVGLEPPDTPCSDFHQATNQNSGNGVFLPVRISKNQPSQLVDKPLHGREPLIEVGKVSVRSVVASRSLSNTAPTMYISISKSPKLHLRHSTCGWR